MAAAPPASDQPAGRLELLHAARTGERETRNCSASLRSVTFAAAPEAIAVHAASLDDPGHFQPQVVTYTLSAPTWDAMDPALRAFERMPE